MVRKNYLRFVLFLGMFALITNYFMDKFSIMRTWRSAPKIGRSIGRFTRRVIFPVCILLMAFNSFRTWPRFPYDGLCEDIDSDTNTNKLSRFALPMNVTLAPSDEFRSKFNINTDMTVTIGPDTPTYKYCKHSEDFMENSRESFTDQESLDNVHTWTFGAVAAFAGLFLASSIRIG